MGWLNDRRPDWTKGRLLPVVVTDVDDGTLLMLAWADAEAVAATEASGQAHFHSRSRDALWRKGATSGHVLDVLELAVDCDADAIAYRVRARGPACHTGTRSCFDGAQRFDLAALARLVDARRSAAPTESYTARLLAGGPRRPAEKVVEEAGEVSAAALAGSDEEVVGEAADLAYHLIVLLASRGIGLEAVQVELARRHAEGDRN